MDFDREMYLPVNPEILWEENQERAKLYWKQPEEMAFRAAKVKELREHYRRNFKKYGLGIEKGSITGLFNVYWMVRGTANIFSCDCTTRLDMMFNNLETWITLMTADYSDYAEKALKKGMTERVLVDLNITLKDGELKMVDWPVIKPRLIKYKKLYEDYREQQEVRYTPVTYTTTRQMIYYNEGGPYLAIDYRRLLSLDPGEPPYYVSTFYFQRDLINHIKDNFEATWANSIPFNDPYGEL